MWGFYNRCKGREFKVIACKEDCKDDHQLFVLIIKRQIVFNCWADLFIISSFSPFYAYWLMLVNMQLHMLSFFPECRFAYTLYSFHRNMQIWPTVICLCSNSEPREWTHGLLDSYMSCFHQNWVQYAYWFQKNKAQVLNAHVWVAI